MNIESSVPLVTRIWTTLYAFRFYNSDDIYIECTVKICPSTSTACDAVGPACFQNIHHIYINIYIPPRITCYSELRGSGNSEVNNGRRLRLGSV